MSSPLTSSSSTGTLVEPFDSYTLQQTPRRKSSSSHGSSVTMITTYPSNEEEFSRFPEAVRRKYFSSVERLRLTQKSNNNRLACANATASSARPGSNSSDCYKRLSVLRHPHSHHRREKEEAKPQVPPQLLLAESDALWYMRLPDSIKRKYFSKEERNILQRRCQELFPDAVADRTIYLLPPRYANRSLTTLTSHSSASINIYEATIERENSHFDQSYKYIDFLDRPSTRSSSLEDTKTDFSSLALPMQNFEPVPMKAAPAPVDMTSRRLMRRSMSLTKNFRQSRSSFTGFVFTASTPTTRSHSHSHSLSYDSMQRSLAGTGLEHDATFWQDPDARHKLRLYLASPQNFDEAIEFGFPSLANDASTKKSEVVETVSIVTDEPEEKVLNTGLRPRPATSGGVESSSRQNSRGLNGPPPPPSRLDNREMTLRMTLTRKDLRAHEDEIYGWQPLRSPLGPPDSPLSPLDVSVPPLSPVAVGPTKKNTATKGWKKIWKKISHA
ncbi:hypothetical protein TWF788_010717 [Orbilia oligospora]|uniref:Uncharacterized protein n=2 Tax=Orbilia oligospora TaxID=2813651 RepID=A0A6G1MHW4_ORBOL|nr:hypothetical protein TWF788_010717 [Orbilia oligospora]KAF3197122.1 hypothetical protein TWF679_003544 [Orbilia oligospora]KAF3219971.1 hypothetical protein TWF191_007544 [Orbilia oligospora]KAF3259556.1 hypothetical protein TWF192_010418 [Orbilia oligospora]